MKMLSATPAFPVRNIPSAVAFYRDRLGFHVRHEDGIVRRDEIELHLWEANSPDTPGAEPHLAGSASCRVQVEGVHALYDEYRDRDVIHPNGALAVQPWGVEDFTILDLDGNAIAFFEPTVLR
jgi:catechol 2,3-dioxygenase-like lactoylglutathione lyase family enzyme